MFIILPLKPMGAWTEKLDKKDFIGEKGIIRQKEQGIDLKLVCFVVEASDSDPISALEKNIILDRP